MSNDKRVYVIWYDNCEPYEDGFQCIEKIFASYDDAKKYLDNMGYVSKTEMRYCNWDSDVLDNEPNNRRKEIEVWGLPIPECAGNCERCDYDKYKECGYAPYDNSEWTIQEWKLN